MLYPNNGSLCFSDCKPGNEARNKYKCSKLVVLLFLVPRPHAFLAPLPIIVFCSHDSTKRGKNSEDANLACFMDNYCNARGFKKGKFDCIGEQRIQKGTIVDNNNLHSVALEGTGILIHQSILHSTDRSLYMHR